MFATMLLLIGGVLNIIWGVCAISNAKFSGGGFGRWIGIIAAALSAIAALLSIPAYPFPAAPDGRRAAWPLRSAARR